ncbi:MAG: SpoIID/LytB domain-containing protein [Candidatus Magasanikbacteria bacterium]
MKRYFKIPLLLFPILILSLFFNVESLKAASLPEVKVRDEGYAVKYISQSVPDPIIIEAGKTTAITYTFKNIGTKTWDSGSKQYISAYTMEPRYRASIFKSSNWLEAGQTAKIEGVVKPGQTGELTLELKAPEKTGTYTEKFWLAADGYSWVKGGYFYAVIHVVEPKEIFSDVTTENKVPVSGDYQAKRILINKKSFTARGGEAIPVIIGYQNIGKGSWKNYTLTSGASAGLAGDVRQLSFAHDNWKSPTIVSEVSEEISSGKVIRHEFFIKTPSKQGTYVLSLSLKTDGVTIPGSETSVSVNVTENAPNYVDDGTPVAIEAPRLAEEPKIRVGLWRDPGTKVDFISADDTYMVYDGETQVGELPVNTKATLTFNNGIYGYKSGDVSFSTGKFIRLVPQNNWRAVFTLINYERLVSWKAKANFNEYRGAMELRQTEDAKTLYVINELMFEDYVAGIGETSNASPIEYIKALLTAARTYAFYIKEYSSKHDSRYFDVVAHTGDQLYLGYVSEKLMPRVVDAANQTRGYMITYDADSNVETPSDIVITPYYGNSDGRTRSWTEVWGGKTKPWLTSVDATYDKRDGRKMNGHGVGMSARDAAIRAEEESADWQSLIKYYYTGVEVEKVY